MAKRSQFAGRLRHAEDGATMLEYALVLAFVAMVCVVAVTALGQSLSGPFKSAITGLS
jgi:pilus assembly protein Flp/PilA